MALISSIPSFELFNMMSNFFPLNVYDLRENACFEESRIAKSINVYNLNPEEFINALCEGLKGKYAASNIQKHIILVCGKDSSFKFEGFVGAIKVEMEAAQSPLHNALSIRCVNYDEFFMIYSKCRLIIESADLANRKMVNNYASEIIPGFLYLGDGLNATDVNHQKDLGITHIIDISGSKISQETAESLGLKYMSIHIWDSEDADIECHFKESNTFIEDCKLNNGKVLVHCRAGISRSSSLVLAYLLHSQVFTDLKSALMFVLKQRPIVCPNTGFRQQLIKEECRLYPTGQASSQEELESIIEEYGKLWSLVETVSTNYDRTPISMKHRSDDILMQDAFPTEPVVINKPKKPFLKRGQGKSGV